MDYDWFKLLLLQITWILGLSWFVLIVHHTKSLFIFCLVTKLISKNTTLVNISYIVFFLLRQRYAAIATMSMAFFSATNLFMTFAALSSTHISIIWLFNTALTTYQIIGWVWVSTNTRFNHGKLKNTIKTKYK